MQTFMMAKSRQNFFVELEAPELRLCLACCCSIDAAPLFCMCIVA